MLRIISACLLLSICISSKAANYYVAKTGNDGNAGTSVSPWLTIGKAASVATTGDSVYVGAGDYNEYVATGAVGVSYATNGAVAVSFRGFRFSHATNTIDGFTISKSSDSHLPAGSAWGASIRVEVAANSSVVTNCVIKDHVYAIATDFRFVSSTNAIISASSDFNAAGFVPQSHIYLGACGLAPYWYTNHNTSWQVKDISGDGHTMWVTNQYGTNFLADAGSNYWAAVHGGSGSEAMFGVNIIKSGGAYASGVVIANNTFSNLFGAAVMANGDGTLVKGNYITKLHGYRMVAMQGRNIVVRDNTFKDAPNILHYTGDEILSLTHPAGADWYDFAVGVISAFSSASTNILFERNWIENSENQLGLADGFSDSSDLRFSSNVFIGVTMHFSGGRNDMKWVNNTFYKCAYNMGASYPLALGSSPPAQTGYVLSSNLFIACGDYISHQSGGFYTISANALNPAGDWNFAAGAEVLGWQAKTGFPTFETNVVNGEDPLFKDANHPIGPDGLPFTADDGLSISPRSKAALYGIGALRSYSSSNPIAHFSVLGNLGWSDSTTTNYDTAWAAMAPFNRPGPIRPYTTPDPLGHIPITVNFTAAGSADGVGADNTNSVGITYYSWNFGDGASIFTVVPNISHTFTKTGTVDVVLWVTNRLGEFDSFTNSYRLLSPTNTIYYVATTGNDANSGLSTTVPFLTVGKAASIVNPGDYVSVGAGQFNEKVDLTRAGTNGAPITWVGCGADIGGWNVRGRYHTFDGFNIDGDGVGAFGGLFYLYAASGNVVIRNCTFHDTTNKYAIVGVRGVDKWPTNSASRLSISNNVIERMDYIAISTHGESNRITGNIFRDNNGQADVFRTWGQGHIISDNLVTNISAEIENHTDVFQVFGYRFERDITFDSNPADGDTVAINGDTRTFKNTVANPATQIQIGINNLVTTTNFYNQIIAHPWSGATTSTTWEEPNNISIRDLSLATFTFTETSAAISSSSVNQTECFVKDILLERNRFWGSRMQICQLETEQNPPAEMTNLVWRNNMFNVNAAANCGMSGVKFYNNLFYQCTSNTGFVLTGGGSKGAAYGTVYKNNIFFESGSNPANTGFGWYSTSPMISNGSLDADYNFVCGFGNAAKATAPPDSFQKWGSYGYESHGINGGDPKFADVANGDYRLAIDSPLLGAGVTVAGFSDTYDRQSRPASWSIGPLESVVGSSSPPVIIVGPSNLVIRKGRLQSLIAH